MTDLVTIARRVRAMRAELDALDLLIGSAPMVVRAMTDAEALDILRADEAERCGDTRTAEMLRALRGEP